MSLMHKSVTIPYLLITALGPRAVIKFLNLESGRLLTFSAFRMGAYLRWALIRGWALILINTVVPIALDEMDISL